MVNEARQNIDGTALEVLGAIAESDACCCGFDEPSNCSIDGCATLPTYLSVTISGVTACGNDGSCNCHCDNVDATYILQHNFLCIWNYNIGNGCRVKAGLAADGCLSNSSHWFVKITQIIGINTKACFNGDGPCHTYENCDHYDTYLPVTINNAIACSGSTFCYIGNGGTAELSLL